VLLVGLKEIIHQFEALLFGFEQLEPSGLCEYLQMDSLKLTILAPPLCLLSLQISALRYSTFPYHTIG
jgi:hypothetical protein